MCILYMAEISSTTVICLSQSIEVMITIEVRDWVSLPGHQPHKVNMLTITPMGDRSGLQPWQDVDSLSMAIIHCQSGTMGLCIVLLEYEIIFTLQDPAHKLMNLIHCMTRCCTICAQANRVYIHH